MPIHTAEDLKNLFKELPSWLESCRKKKSLVKSGRWFSWHGACQEHLGEFWALGMILKQHAFPEAQDPNENLSFKELRMDDGGRPMWKWWAETIKKVKSPCDALRNYISLTTPTFKSQWPACNAARRLPMCQSTALLFKARLTTMFCSCGFMLLDCSASLSVGV